MSSQENRSPNRFVNPRLRDMQPDAGHGQWRVFVLGGLLSDVFFNGYERGLVSLCGDPTRSGSFGALELLAERTARGRRSGGGGLVMVNVGTNEALSFPKPEMEQRFLYAASHESRDSEASGRTQHTFRRRRDRLADSPAGAASSSAPSPASGEPAGVEGREQAEEAARRVAERTALSGANFYERIGRLLDDKSLDSVVIVHHPENILPFMQNPSERLKIQAIAGWFSKCAGNPNARVYLLVEKSKMSDFIREIPESLYGLTGHEVVLDSPDQYEIEAFFRRVICRHGLEGDPRSIAAAALSPEMRDPMKKLMMHHISDNTARFMTENPGQSLERLYDMKSKREVLDEILAKIDNLSGMEPFKKKIHQFVALAEQYREMERAGNKQPLPFLAFSFLGNPGSGKTMAARLIGDLFWALDFLPRRGFTEVTPKDITGPNRSEITAGMKRFIDESMGATLFVDEAYQIAENEMSRPAIEALMSVMSNTESRICIIFAGYADKQEVLYSVNEGMRSRLESGVVNFPDYGIDELIAIFRKELDSRKLVMGAGSEDKLRAYFTSCKRRGGIGNGRGAVETLAEAQRRMASDRANDGRTLEAGHIPDPIVFNEPEACRALRAITDYFRGQPDVTAKLETLYQQKRNELLGGVRPNTDIGQHFVFMGPTGTGKTTLARMVGELFFHMGLISGGGPGGKLLEEINISQLLGVNPGDTVQRINSTFERAKGKVLFLDEAYRLVKHDMGKQAIDEIVTTLTRPANQDLVVVMAGYNKEMKQLLDENEGMSRRFANQIRFRNMDAPSLANVFFTVCEKRDLHFVPEDLPRIRAWVTERFRRLSRGKNFGNAGAVAPFIEQEILGRATLSRPSVEQPLSFVDLNLPELPGAAEIVQPVADFLVGRKRFLLEFTDTVQSLLLDPGIFDRSHHLFLTGDHGVGKSAILRCIARSYVALGIVADSVGEVVETPAANLGAGFVGQSQKATAAWVDEHEGKVLAITGLDYFLEAATDDKKSFAPDVIRELVQQMSLSKNMATPFVFCGTDEQARQLFRLYPFFSNCFSTRFELDAFTPDEGVELLRREWTAQGKTFPSAEAFQAALVDLVAARMRSPDFANGHSLMQMRDEISRNVNRRILNEHRDADSEEKKRLARAITIQDILGLLAQE